MFFIKLFTSYKVLNEGVFSWGYRDIVQIFCKMDVQTGTRGKGVI